MPNPAEVKAARIKDARLRMLEHINDNVDEALIRRVTIKDFRATDKKVAYALAYVCAPPNTDRETIARTAGIDPRSVRLWREQPLFNAWLHAVCMACTGSCVSLVWRVIGELAAGGNVQASKMILQRFDVDWRAIQANTPLPSDELVPDAADMKATREALPTSEDKPIEPVADGSGTAAGDAPQAQAPQVSPSEEEGAGGE